MATKAKPSTAVASKKNTDLANPMMNMRQDAGGGLEEADASSFAIPFLTVLQSNSPAVVDDAIEGVKAGLFMNTITNELYKEVLVVPCAFQRRFLRWGPRSQGGGYKGEYLPGEVESETLVGLTKEGRVYLMDVPEGATKLFDDKGLPLYDHLKDTRSHFVLVQNSAGQWQPAMLSLSSTQIKKSKRWMSLIQGIEFEDETGSYNPPSYSHIYRLATDKESNDSGTWFGVTISKERALDPSELSDVNIYMRAKEFHDQVAAGKVKVSEPVDEQAASTGTNDEAF